MSSIKIQKLIAFGLLFNWWENKALAQQKNALKLPLAKRDICIRVLTPKDHRICLTYSGLYCKLRKSKSTDVISNSKKRWKDQSNQKTV